MADITELPLKAEKPNKKTRQQASAENGKLGGRPTMYSETYVELAEEYLESCKDEQTKLVKSAAEGTTMTGSSKSMSWQYGVKVKLPSLEGLMGHYMDRGLDITRQTIGEWRATYPRFSYVVKKILNEQANRLINNSISGDYNPVIAKLLLSKHGYVEKAEVEIDSQGEQAKKAFYETMKGRVDSMPTDEVNSVLTDLLKG